MKMNKRYIYLMLGAVLMASCSSQSDLLPDAQNDDASIIHVGQVSVANMLGPAAVTRSSSIIGDDKLSCTCPRRSCSFFDKLCRTERTSCRYSCFLSQYPS